MAAAAGRRGAGNAGERDVAGARRDRRRSREADFGGAGAAAGAVSVMLPAPVLLTAPFWRMPKFWLPLELPPVPVIEIAPPEAASEAPP